MVRSRLAWAAIALFCAVVLTTQARAKEPIEIIAAFNLTGADSVLDVSAYRGAKLAVQEINGTGGVYWRPLKLIEVDTQSDPSSTAAKMRAALEANPDTVAGVGFSYNTYALQAGPVFQAAGLPFVSPGATGSKVPEQVGDDMFLIAYGDDAQARAMAEFARTELRLSNVIVWMNADRDYTRTVGRYFTEFLGRSGGRVQLRRYDGRKTDFSDLIEYVQKSDPKVDGIYAASLPSTAVQLIGQVRAAGIDIPLMSGDGWDEKDIVDLSRSKQLGGIYFTTHRFLGVDTPAMLSFIAAYTRAYGEAPTDAFAPLGYDAVYLIADAIRRAGSAKPAAIRAALADTKHFPGIVGEIAYPPDKRIPDKVVSVVRVDDGAAKVMWTGRAKSSASAAD